MLSGDFVAATFHLTLAAYAFWEELSKKQNRLGQSTMEHTSNKYLSILRLDVWLSEQAEHGPHAVICMSQAC